MADYLVTDTELTSIANAIRTKGGTSASLEFPQEFVQAINDIQTGGGSKTNIDIGQASPANILNMFYALEQGTASTGTFTMTQFLPNTDTLIFDSGLNDVNGFAIFDTSYSSDHSSSHNFSAVQLMIVTKFLVPYNRKNEFTYGCVSITENNANAQASLSGVVAGNLDNLDGTGIIRFAYFTLTNGVLYAKGQYNRHNTYTPFNINTAYRWVAW